MADHRPEFMSVLGVLPPYLLEDVQQAFRSRAQTAHPDHGGSIDEFLAVREAYEQACQYLEFRTDRRVWIAAQMDRYVAQQDVESQLRGYGAEVTVDSKDWLRRSFGDFAELFMAVQAIELLDSKAGREVVELIVAKHDSLSGLKQLALRNCDLVDDDVTGLRCFHVLEHLDLTGNSVTNRVVELASALPTLRSMTLDDTGVTWWRRTKLGMQLRRRTGGMSNHLPFI